MSARALVAEGSVKNLWSTENSNEIDFEFSDAYSVFDWGRMPDQLQGKGEALAQIGAFFFETLASPDPWTDFFKNADAAVVRLGTKQGLSGETLIKTADELTRKGLISHYLAAVDTRSFRVRRAEVFVPKPATYYGSSAFSYPLQPYLLCRSLKLIPLEVVFRFGVPHGSSYFARATQSSVESLGATWPLKEQARFSFPVIEFFTKLEDTDRFLNFTDAMTLSGLSKVAFDRLIAKTALLGLWLQNFFATRGLELWDGKFEWGALETNDGTELVLLDSIGPDELRLTEPKSGMQVSKEFL
ncbi:MAG TPA: phosphoribosylaminoimidazolesuccinocarboxamide synthase, partial [Oligoflexia bacterium]|nr:phosphoribosylaminoimidazolesuccinocarboxamide synthase [Oligoflexia bacterium]